MNLNEAKVGMYICKIGDPRYIQKITRINQKSIVCGYYTLREKELIDYIIVEEAVAKKHTIKTIINDGIKDVGSMKYRLQDIGQIIERYKDYIKFDSNKINAEIEELIAKINNILNAIENEKV